MSAPVAARINISYSQTMLRHVVLFTWTRHASPQAIESAKERMRNYGGSNERCLTFVVADNVGANPGNFDTVVIADFPSLEDYKAYALDPRHVAVIDGNREVVSEKASIQYETT